MRDYPQAYRRFIALFNAGEFHEAPEELEPLWRVAGDDVKPFYQGLIQIAVALYHHGRGNGVGARKLRDRSGRHLAAYQPVFMGIDVGRLHEGLVQALNGGDVPVIVVLDTDLLQSLHGDTQ